METDKDKHLPDKSLSFSSKNENQDVNINPSPPTEPATASEIAELEANADNPGTEKKDGEEEHHKTDDHETDIIIEEGEVPDLSKVSVEIDQFISNLSAEQSEPPKIPDFLEQFAFLVEAKIANYDSVDTMKWTQLPEEDSNSILEHVERISNLSTSLSKFSSDSDFASSINRIGGILQRALSYLEEEFRLILEDYKVADPDPDSKTKQSSETDQTVSEPEVQNYFLGYSEEIVSNLNTLVHAIISAGHEPECCQEYFISRRKAMEVTLNELGFDKCSIDDVQKKNWDSLEGDIGTWNKTFKEFSNRLLPCERKLAESVFSRYEPISMNLFGMLSRGMMIQLLNFAEAVAMTKRSAEKLFKFLDVYETLRDLFLTVDELFPSDYVAEFKSEAILTRSRLGEAMICIFCDLENSIKADTGKTPVAGGAVHPLTRYIMNYLKYACEYKDTLEQVFKEHQKIERADSVDRSDFNAPSNSQSQNYSNNETSKQSPFELQLSKVMDLLDMNLDSKSKLYKDTSLSLIFLMNNGRYILQKIKGSAEIKSLLGDTWCRKRSSDLRSYHKSYQRETWGKLLQCLSLDGLNVNGKVVKPVLKEKFKGFNAMFDEIHKTQSTWIVSDEQLQSELRVSISAIVTPAYRSFMARFSSTFTPGRQTEKYIKYQPEDIETYIEELFDGASASAAVGRRR